jgi:hypothetical protein
MLSSICLSILQLIPLFFFPSIISSFLPQSSSHFTHFFSPIYPSFLSFIHPFIHTFPPTFQPLSFRFLPCLLLCFLLFISLYFYRKPPNISPGLIFVRKHFFLNCFHYMAKRSSISGPVLLQEETRIPVEYL